MKAVLQSLSKSKDTGGSTKSAEDAQGTEYLLRNQQISNQENFKMTDDPGESCRKDIGILHRLHSWSRGVEEIVGGGGIIEYWAPIYDSEGPVQVFFIILKYLQLRLKGRGEEEFKKFFLSYDNMCHLDSLRLVFSYSLLAPTGALPNPRIWLSVCLFVCPSVSVTKRPQRLTHYPKANTLSNG